MWRNGHQILLGPDSSAKKKKKRLGYFNIEYKYQEAVNSEVYRLATAARMLGELWWMKRLPGGCQFGDVTVRGCACVKAILAYGDISGCC